MFWDIVKPATQPINKPTYQDEKTVQMYWLLYNKEFC